MSDKAPLEAGELTLQELELRLRWLIDLRWLAVAGVITLPAAATILLHFQLPVPSLALAGVGIAAYNMAFRAWLKSRRAALTERLAHRMANVQIAADLAALTAVLHLSGGVDNPLWSYYVFHVIIAATMLSPLEAYAQATWGIVLFAALVAAEALGILPHYHLPMLADPELHRSLHAWLVVAALASVLYISAYLACSIAQRLREREQQLERLTREARVRAEQCQLAYDRLSQVQKVQVEYMRKMAHEIKAPFAAIATGLSVLLDGLVGEIPPKQRELLERARRRAQDGIAMANDLLDLARLRDLPEQRFEPVDMAHVISQVAELYAEQAAAKNIALHVDVADGLPLVLGDEDALSTMLSNLVSNAIKYTPEGGEVAISAAAEPGRVVVRVSDTGRGIAKDDIPRLFQEFYRTPDARRSGIEGTGLGLAIVKSVVDRHNGTIEVESELGKGTTFTVRLPAADQVSALSPEASNG